MGDKLGKYEDFDRLSESNVNETERRVVFDQEDFQVLVSGGIVDKDGVKIILKDIGYDVMLQIITELKSNLK